ncbi:hypothetical protein [Actinokineospora sp. HUAS TT18]|uniref:hypothetical protein n=1 Tax=Actinokineospora sp. HUAS TT18 TaxID=3447451 RepID=UPI003F526742
MGNWVSDYDVQMARQYMQDAVVMMFDSGWLAEWPGELVDASRRHVEIANSLEPQKIADEFDRTLRAAQSVGQNAEAVAKLRVAATSHLVGWTGPAATAYKEQLAKMETFCEHQQTDLANALQALTATFGVAVEVRRGYHSLFLSTIEAAKHEMDQQDGRDTKFAVALIGDFAKGALNINPIRLLSGGALETLIDVGTHVHEYAAEGGADAVVNTYLSAANRLEEELRDGLLTIRGHLRGHLDRVAKIDPPLFRPLPSNCDIDSPDFRYESFALAGQDRSVTDGLAPRVSAEREKYAKETTDRDNPIGRRLDGDKGAI